MTDRDEMVRVVAAVLAPRLYAPDVSAFDVAICFRQTFEDALAGARARVEHQAAAVVDALGERLAQAWDEGKGAALTWVYRQDDADTAGQHYLVPEPRNPYRTDDPKETDR